MLLSRVGWLLAALAAPMLCAATPAKVTVAGADGGRPQADQPLRLTVTTPARSAAGTPAQPPLAWIDHAETVSPEAGMCEQRADRLLASGPLQPAARDFNGVHVVTLTDTGALHVLDPRSGIRGARSVAHLDLGGRPGAWLWAAGDGLVWVALPDNGRAVGVDVARWTVARTLDGLGAAPAIVPGPGNTLYVLARGGVRRIDGGRDVNVPGGEGAVGLAAGAAGDVWALGQDDLRRLEADGAHRFPIRLRQAAWSPRADRLVGLDAAGGLVMVDRQGRATPVAGAPAFRDGSSLWVSPDGAMAVVHNASERGLHVASLETGRYARRVDAPRPLALAASDSFLFVRTAERGETMVLPLAELARPQGGAARWIAGGEVPGSGRPASVTATPEGLAAWIDPERNVVFLYHEGMNIPSGTLRNPGPAPERLMLVGPGLRPRGGGRFEAAFMLDEPGDYVAVTLGLQPRFTTCTSFKVAGSAKAAGRAPELRLRLAAGDTTARVGAQFHVRFALEGAAPPAIGVVMMGVQGGDQQRLQARAIGGGLYEVAGTAPRPGAYLLMPDPVTLPDTVIGRPAASVLVSP